MQIQSILPARVKQFFNWLLACPFWRWLIFSVIASISLRFLMFGTFRTEVTYPESKSIPQLQTLSWRERIQTWVRSHPEAMIIISILIIAALAHGINMFNFPYYEDDEGTYISQAWAILKTGQLAPYTYWYDHAPFGWIQVAAWLILTGGVHTFGDSVESGRLLMLLMQVGSTFFVYQIAKKASGYRIPAVVASLTFALSPYGLYYHRRLLLDNIATFWMLASILVLFSKNSSLNRYWLSALFLGFAILSKEVAVFVIPAEAYLVYTLAHQKHRTFALAGWVTIVGSIVSIYILMALIKNEFFPTGTLLGGNSPHVSLLGSLFYQTSRGINGGLLNPNSFFWQLAHMWMREDPLLVIYGTLSAFLLVLLIKWKRVTGIIGLFALSLWAFLGRGGEVIEFYLIPLIPFLALSLGFLVGVLQDEVSDFIRRSHSPNRWPVQFPSLLQKIPAAMGILCVVGIFSGYSSPNFGLDRDHLVFWDNSTAVAQRQAISWIESHIPPNSRMAIDMYMWDDLHDPVQGEPKFQSSHYYWKIDFDPAIQNGVFHDNWKNIDYVITTPQVNYDSQHNAGMVLVRQAIQHAKMVKSFKTGFWEVDVLKVKK